MSRATSASSSSSHPPDMHDPPAVDPAALSASLRGEGALDPPRLLGRSGGHRFSPSSSVYAVSLPQGSGQVRSFAVKRYHLEEVASDRRRRTGADAMEHEDETELIRAEVRHLRQLRHPNLLPLLGAFVCGSEVLLAFPRAALGSVRGILRTHFREGLPEAAVAFILRDVLQALKYLHSKGIVHRSVRCSHILLSESGPALLSGLKYACSLVETGRGIQDRYDYPLFVAETNLPWLSPEFLQQNLLGYNERADVYALGASACEAANGAPPFADMPPTLMLLEKFRGAAPRLIDASTFEEQRQQQQQIQQQQQMQQHDQAVAFPTDQPADSGVGASVGSCSNVNGGGGRQQQGQQQQQHPQLDPAFAQRTFSEAFHSFVEDSCRLEAEARPSAAQLLSSHPFIKQLKKTPMSFSSILKSVKSIESDASADGGGIAKKPGGLDLSKDCGGGEEGSPDESQAFQWDF